MHEPHLSHNLVRTSPFYWETNFYTPPVLGGAAFLPFSAPAVCKNQGPYGTGNLYTAGAENGKRAAPPSTGSEPIFGKGMRRITFQ